LCMWCTGICNCQLMFALAVCGCVAGAVFVRLMVCVTPLVCELAQGSYSFFFFFLQQTPLVFLVCLCIIKMVNWNAQVSARSQSYLVFFSLRNPLLVLSGLLYSSLQLCSVISSQFCVFCVVERSQHSP